MSLEDIDCIVLCGGLGKRLVNTLEPNTPKVLAPVNGRPTIDYVIGTLQQANATRVILAAAHLSHKLIDWMEGRPDDGVEVVASVQITPDGTVDAVRTARHAIRSDPVLLCNGDTVTTASLCEFVRQYKGDVAYLRLPPVYVVGPQRSQHRAIDSGIRLFSRRHIDSMLRSGAYRVEDYVSNFGAPVDLPGTFLDIGSSPKHYQQADEYCRFLLS